MSENRSNPLSSDRSGQVQCAGLAGLLHDIGKFSQRAGRAGAEICNQELRDAIGYQHAIASSSFMRQHVPEEWQTALSGVPFHHRPQSLRDRWVQLADLMSCSEPVDKDHGKVYRLRTTFSRLYEFDPPSYWPLSRLNYADRTRLFPRPEHDQERTQQSQRQYADLWEEFERECVRRRLTPDTTLDLTAFAENLLAVLQEFTWCIPSSFRKSVPDVSLFDHLRSTAALAACLAADERDEDWCRRVYDDLKNDRTSSQAALLIAGDLGGIQDFVYTLSSESKSLRARSFYVQMLSQVVALNLLDTLGLPLTNLIYAGGGGFYLLAPMSAAGRLPEVAQSIVDRLLLAHQGTLGLSLAWEPVPAHMFGRFNRVLEQVAQALNRIKRRPFSQASTAMLAAQIGTPITHASDPLKFCAVTGDEWDLVEKDGECKTRMVWSLEELGQVLPRATHLVLCPTDRPQTLRPHTWQEALALFGYAATVIVDNALPALNSQALVRIWRLDPSNRGDEPRLLAALPETAQVVISERPIPKSATLDRGGRVFSFDGSAEEQANGIKRWGVHRLDVDNVGQWFRIGLGENASLSRAASLSSGLRLFFEDWLPQLAGDDLRDRISILYSGGDDLFVVGAWDALPEFALRVHDSFREFTGGNPNLTLSGGIAIVDAGFPFAQAARLARQAEGAAKSYVHGQGAEKNAITFLGHTGAWPALGETKAKAERLAEWCLQDRVNKSLLQVVIQLAHQVALARQAAQRAGKPAQPLYGRWMWTAADQLTRMERGADDDVSKGLRVIQESFLKPGVEATQWGLAARWAQHLVPGDH